VDEADVVAGGALADAARGEAHAVRAQPFDGLRQVVDPQPHVVQRRLVHRGLLRRIDRLHQVDLDAVDAAAEREDVLVDVLALAPVVAGARHAERIHPEPRELRLVEAADRDLLQAEDAEGSLTHLFYAPWSRR